MINEGEAISSDFKTDKNGRKYPAKKIKLGSEIQEASYKGNIGIMELTKFHSAASPKDKAVFSALMMKKSKASSEHEASQLASQIWDHVQKVTNTRLHQMENKELLSFTDFIMKESAPVAEEIIPETVEETNTTTVEEAMETKRFNNLVNGYLKHSKAARVGGFKKMSFKQYSDTVDKALKHPKTMEEQKIEIKIPKPRDPNHVILAAKKNAAGKHKNKKRESKMGDGKHKERQTSDFL